MMARVDGEMPFLDHLEELRWRLLWVVLTYVVAVFAAFVILAKIDVLVWLQAPIHGLLKGKKLVYTHPGDPFQIVLNFSLALGLIFSLPMIVWQGWGFLAPALHRNERRVVVPVFVGALALFLAGAAMAYFFVLPFSLNFLLNFQSDAFDPMITASEYFGFVISMVLGFGAAFELPIVILALSALGIVTPQFLGRYRRHAAVGCVIAGSVLTPGDLIYASAMMAGPLYLLYEVSIWLSYLVQRRKKEPEAIGNEAAA